MTFNNYPRIEELEEECLRQMAENGIPFTGPLEETGAGVFKRFSVDSKASQKDEFYACTKGDINGFPYLHCCYGTWSGGLVQFSYSSFENNKPRDLEASQKIIIRLEENKKKQVQAFEKEKAERLKKALNFWEGAFCDPYHEDHSIYLNNKKIKSVGLRYSEDEWGNKVLVIPLVDVEEKLQAVQVIYSDGRKKIYGLKKGNFFVLGTVEKNSTVYFSEGYATACSVYEAGKSPVVVAFDCNNLGPVIENFRKRYPIHKFVIAGDDDQENEKNPGRRCAEESSKKYMTSVVFPQLRKRVSDASLRVTDFNDLHVLFGISEVAEQLRDVVFPDSEKNFYANSKIITDPCSEFSFECIPELIRDYVQVISEETDAHQIMILTPLLASISAYFKTNVYLKEGEYFQVLYCVLWILNIAESGQFKSTAINKGAAIAYQKSRDVRAKIEEIEAKVKQSDKNNLDEQKLLASLQDVILPSKITTEGFIEHLAQGHAGAVFASEFGAWLQNFEKHYNRDLKALLTDFFDVPDTYRYKTKSSGDWILNKPYLSICGASTIDWLAKSLKDDDVASGFFARFLIFQPPNNNAIPSALPGRTSNELKLKLEMKIKEKLCENNKVYAYVLSNSARGEFESAHHCLYSLPEVWSQNCKEILAPFLKRWSPYILKIAMMLRFFEDPSSMELSDTSIIGAKNIIMPAVKSTMKLFQEDLGESDHQRRCRRILDWINNRISKRKPASWGALIISKILPGGSSMYQYPVDTLLESGQISQIKSDQKKDILFFPTGITPE